MEISLFAKTLPQDITAYALKVIERGQMQRLLVNKLMSIFYARATLNVQTTPNVLKVNASVKKVLKHLDLYASILMNAEAIQTFVEIKQLVSTSLDPINVNAMLVS